MNLRFFPGLNNFRGITRDSARRDVMAGLSVAAVALPVGLAYAAMMGVPPVAGLWAAIAGMLGYALFGSSRTLIVGPDTATCTLIAATLTGMALTSPEDRLVAATGIALTVGVGCLIARVLRLGVLANLLSRPVLIGYMAGVAITLAMSQLSGLTGVGLRNSGLVHPFLELSRRIQEIQIPTLCLGLASCILLVGLKRWRPAWPGPILLVLGGCLLSWLFNFPELGIAVVGEVPAGLPGISLPVRLEGVDSMLLGAAGVLVVSFSSGIVTARSFAARTGEHVDPNRELVGFGAANVAAGLFQGFVVTGADSRTAVGLVAGGSSPLVSISAAMALAIVVGLLSEPLYWLPQAVLSAILLLAAVSLFDVKAFMRLARISRIELAFGILAAVGVVGFGVLQGVAVSVGATLLYAMYVSGNPRDALLGRLPGESVLGKLHLNPEAQPVPGAVIWLFESSVWFFNADAFRRRAREVMDQAGDVQWFVLDAEAMTQADADAVEALYELKRELDDRHITLLVAGGHGQFRMALERSGLVKKIGRDKIFGSPEQAVEAIERWRQPAPETLA
ncbi:SulP family inorganic anion transporter [Achromobacter kerstersii]|jgi:high affinity sulfate transporter 1|uniref:SulP family inorganic anion transporter n=1 Tax=Achromobacter kerstersii TaxID=1353890 RepID=UPI0006C410A9|nr:SulP family inorganic anion transporter [Achromobacter kerstersii]CUI83365.1 Probable sulfate transporter Rv1739c/MT1781 [Achromobacter kerstersii]